MSKIIRQLEADEMLDNIMKFHIETIAALLMIKKKHGANYDELKEEIICVAEYLRDAIDGEL